MAIVKGPAVAAFMRAPPAETKAVLVYGADAGRVREVAVAIVAAVAGSPDDPFAVARLSDDRLAADPALLGDEARALSFSGGRRVVWVSSAARGLQLAAEAYLADPGGEALIVAEAGALPKSSKLRVLFETSKRAAAIACYEDSDEDLRNLVLRTLSEAGLAASDDVLEHIAARIGSDRALSRRELEKLVLYCHGRPSVELADVDAVSGDVSALSMEALADAIFEGDVPESCRRLLQLAEAGTAASSVLSGIGSHVARLQEFRSEADHGKSRDVLVRSARPPIHFKRQPRISRQLAVWPGPALDEAMRTVLMATRQTRQFSNLDYSITERAVLALARRARGLRSKSA